MKSGSGKINTRDVVLRSIKSMNQATVDDLAAAAGVSPVTVRHHLNSLMSDGLISAESIRRKVGRPYHVYSLSEKGNELFPKKYFALSSRLLEELKERFPEDVVTELFESLVQRIVDEHRHEFEPLGFEARLDYVVQLLADEGFLAKWEKDGEDYKLTEYSCPFMGIGQQHVEICTLDTALIEAVMGSPIKQHSCMLHGDDCCQFTVSPEQQTITLPEVQIQ